MAAGLKAGTHIGSRAMTNWTSRAEALKKSRRAGEVAREVEVLKTEIVVLHSAAIATVGKNRTGVSAIPRPAIRSGNQSPRIISGVIAITDVILPRSVSTRISGAFLI